MKPYLLKLVLAGCGLFVAAAAPASAQMIAKTSDATAELAPDGSATVTFAYSFDAGPWGIWKANIGDDPARTRASIRYNFGARVALDGFKLERDDLNRTAKITVHSAVAAELRRDGRYSFPVDKEFRLVNNVGQVWFFSGNMGNTLSTLKIVLPPAATGAAVADTGSAEQALTYSLPARHGIAFRNTIAGVVLLGIGLVLLGAAWLGRSKPGPVAAPSATT